MSSTADPGGLIGGIQPGRLGAWSRRQDPAYAPFPAHHPVANTKFDSVKPGLRGEAVASDGVIHLAFKHDIAFSGGFQGAADADRRAIETFGEALAGSGRPFVIASGTLGLVPDKLQPSGTDMVRLLRI